MRFLSIWISPDGDTLDCEVESHDKAISLLKLDQEIAAHKEDIQWSETELKQGYDRDNVISLMKIGWVRVAVIADQIGIEHCGILKQQTKTICEFIKSREKLAERQQTIVIENFSTHEYKMFSSISTACIYIMSLSV